MRRSARPARCRGVPLLPLIAFIAVSVLATGTATSQPADVRQIDAGSSRVVYWARHHELAARVATIVEEPLRLPGLPGAATPENSTIYLAPSPPVFDSLTGGRAPHWSAGVAIPAQRVVVIPVYPVRADFQRDPLVTLRHELAHLVLHHELPAPPPRWFDEGYATWASGGWDQSSAWQIRLAFLLGRAPPLDSLTLEWPRGAEEARLAYLLSASAVRYLAEIGGAHGFEILLSVWREEGSLDAALRQVYGMTPGQFERNWGRMVQRRYGWLLAISQIALFWTFAALLLIVLFWIRRRRKRERLAQLELEELASPDGEGEDPGSAEDPEVPPPRGVDASRHAE